MLSVHGTVHCYCSLFQLRVLHYMLNYCSIFLGLCIYYIQFQIDLSVNSSASVNVFIDLEQDLTENLSVFDAIVNNYSKKEI